MGRDEMRAGDADRQQVADRLRRALEEGRLDLGEYDERLQRAYAAKTYGDLGGLLDDLPAGPATPAVPHAGVPHAAAPPDLYHHATRRWLWENWESWFGVVGLVIGIWAFICLSAGELTYFWPMWVAGPWGLVLMGQTVAGLARDEPRKWVDREERKRQEKIAKRDRKALEAERQAEQSGRQAEPQGVPAQPEPAVALGHEPAVALGPEPAVALPPEPVPQREPQPRPGDRKRA
jgi:hypothetical protein